MNFSLGVALADVFGVAFAEDFLDATFAGVVFLTLAGRAGVAAFETGDLVLGMEAGFLVAAAFLAFATVTFLATTLGFFSILVAGFFAGAFLDLGSVFFTAGAVYAFLAI